MQKLQTVLPTAGSLSWPLGDIFREIEWERGEWSEGAFGYGFLAERGEFLGNERERTGKFEVGERCEFLESLERDIFEGVHWSCRSFRGISGLGKESKLEKRIHGS